MTSMSQEQKEDNAQATLELLSLLHDGMWDAASKINETAIPKPAKLGNELFNHVMNNAVDNELSANPTKYVANAATTYLATKLAANALARYGLVISITGAALAGVLASLGFDLAYLENIGEDAFGSGLRDWIDGFNNWAGDKAEYAAKMPSEFKQFMEDLTTESMQAMKDFAEKMQNDINKTIDDISQYLKEAYEQVINNLAEAYDFIADQLYDLLNKAGDAVNDAWKGINDFLNNGGDLFNSLSDDLQKLFNNVMATPIVLDLDGDGVELIALEASATVFDMDNDGFAEASGWVKPDDGLLAFDVNGNGKIDNQSELFGGGGSFSNGFAKLTSQFDTNKDDAITSADAQFNQLLVWRDVNGNGVSDAGELKTFCI